MSKFNCRNKKTINDIEVTLYDVDLEKEDEINDLKNWLQQKIKRMNMHNADFIDTFNVPTISEEFRQRIKEKYEKNSNPIENKIEWFDVRRSRVTEFMAQRLLEKQYNCLFYEEADKKITASIIDRDKHVGGVDVTGIKKEEDDFKFVICEVKSSSSKSIPCENAKELLKDINASFYNDKDRTTKEIMNYFKSLSNSLTNDELIHNILIFLINLVDELGNESVIKNKLVFFPFLIRNNKKVCEEYELNDFSNFKNDDFKNTEMKGIIWAFNTDIDEFVKKIYNEVENV